ncbi:MAG: acetyl-CoA carboxylase biotin carboxylase subunit family protein, partial [Myxococcales bacterium]|nr:acetyl-CoA carboxylase biotin carboxylase subunit family protein [Myxococcales bacterium]
MSHTHPNSPAAEMSRIAILNRGEPAVRFCRAVRDYNAERQTQLSSVALYTEPDAGSPFTRLADDALCIGPAMVPGPDGAMISAYLDIDRVIAALRRSGCDAVWPGWGFAAEDAAFVGKLEQSGFIFLGPSAEAMDRLGDKIAAKTLAEDCGVPLAPWWQVPAEVEPDEIIAQAARIGYPIMVKASAGGGGRGIRKVDSADALLAAVGAVREEVRKVFGAGGLLLEACVTGARHVEVQLVGGADGKTVALGVRDCSIQRRNQKILEEAPSSVLPPHMERLLCESSVRLAEKAGYQSAGTAEFLYNPVTEQACFLEVNSRLQVEHTVTECVTGIDLVHAQIDVARGLSLTECGALNADGTPPQVRGWSIEARLCAEDAARGFAPSPGKVTVFRPPSGPGIRVDSGIAEGSVIAAEFDSMIAKVIATGATRRQAVARLRRALSELQVVIEDGATNKALLLELLERDEVTDGSADTGWLDRALADGEVAQHRRTFEALCFGAIVEYRRQRHADVNAFFLAAQGGIPQHPPTPEPLEIELVLANQRQTLLVHELGESRYLVGPNGALHVAHVV